MSSISFLGNSQPNPVGYSSLRFAPTRSRIMGGNISGMMYPNPFFDLGHTYLPTSIKHLFRYCRYYFLLTGPIHAIICKLSEYPVTDIVLEHEDAKVRSRWYEFLSDHLRYRSFQIELGYDYFTYGNAFVTINYPLMRWLTCSSCGHTGTAQGLQKNWRYSFNKFKLTCPKCGQTTDAKVRDIYVRDPNRVKLIRWNVEDVELKKNPFTHETEFYIQIPGSVVNDIKMGKKSVVMSAPMAYLDAVKEDRPGVIFAQDAVFHLRRASISGMEQDMGWGIPLILPVLKDCFLYQVMKKSQETIFMEHVVPLRVLFPQPGSGSSDPYCSIDLSQWRSAVGEEIARWRWDNNYIPIVPLPIGQQVIGAEGKGLLLDASIQQHVDNIVTALQVPKEFYYGGASWSGTNVSMRMIENFFLNYIGEHRDLLKWVTTSIGKYFGWPIPDGKFKPFRMADDLQRSSLLMNVNAQGKISDTSFLSSLDYDQERENEIMDQENTARVNIMRKQQLAMADVQGEAMLIQAKYQAQSQQVMMKAQMTAQQGMTAQGEPGDQAALVGPSAEMQSQLKQAQPGIDLNSFVEIQAKTILNMPPQMVEGALQNLEVWSPELSGLVAQRVAELRTMQAAGGDTGVDMRPLPEKKPPRRATPVV